MVHGMSMYPPVQPYGGQRPLFYLCGGQLWLTTTSNQTLHNTLV